MKNKISITIFSLIFSILIWGSITLSEQYYSYKEFNIKDGIIIESSVFVKSSPDYSSKDSFQIHEGLKVRIEDKVDDWVKIRLDDGKIGWIAGKNIGII